MQDDGERMGPSENRIATLVAARAELERHLVDGIVAFWSTRAIDDRHGGFLTCYDADGRLDERYPDKYLVTQTRMIWGYATLARRYPHRPEFERAYAQGVDFLIAHFWDGAHGGWRWRVRRDGTPVDDAKLVYGQVFAIYALADAYLATGDVRARDHAVRTFDLLETHAADRARGGWLENLAADWSPLPAGFEGGDRKSLDIHMHVMEALTSLALATGDPRHRERLDDAIAIILRHMIDPASGAGRNQFDLDFAPRPAIDIARTWNAERGATGDAAPGDTTSYGHNLELGWLLIRAGEALGRPVDHYASTVAGLCRHALRDGYDAARGGVFRDGPHGGPASVRDKEFWQNAEALPGSLRGYEACGDDALIDAFLRTWDFAKRHLIDEALGEWRVLVAEDGRVVDGAMGNPWKAFYHSGRSVIEAVAAIDRIVGGSRHA